MEPSAFDQKCETQEFTKTPIPLSKSPGHSPSIRSMTQTVIVSLAETVTHNITYGKVKIFFIESTSMLMFICVVGPGM